MTHYSLSSLQLYSTRSCSSVSALNSWTQNWWKTQVLRLPKVFRLLRECKARHTLGNRGRDFFWEQLPVWLDLQRGLFYALNCLHWGTFFSFSCGWIGALNFYQAFNGAFFRGAKVAMLLTNKKPGRKDYIPCYFRVLFYCSFFFSFPYFKASLERGFG